MLCTPTMYLPCLSNIINVYHKLKILMYSIRSVFVHIIAVCLYHRAGHYMMGGHQGGAIPSHHSMGHQSQQSSRHPQPIPGKYTYILYIELGGGGGGGGGAMKE